MQLQCISWRVMSGMIMRVKGDVASHSDRCRSSRPCKGSVVPSSTAYVQTVGVMAQGLTHHPFQARHQPAGHMFCNFLLPADCESSVSIMQKGMSCSVLGRQVMDSGSCS